MGESTRKLRYVIYYTLYRMDPQKTHYQHSCVRNNIKNIKLRQTQFHMKDTGKSSSRKLRRVV